MNGNNCGNCKFSLVADKDTIYCRRYPPTVMFAPTQEANLAGDVTIVFKAQGSAFPRLRAIGWCGEHDQPHNVLSS
jgi:hypothetical protein